jgi:hypothetical protein
LRRGQTVAGVITPLNRGDVRDRSLDHDLGGGKRGGARCACRWPNDTWRAETIGVHSANPSALTTCAA